MPEHRFILETGPISAETKKIAETELNETPERVEESIAELRRLLHENTDLHFRDDDDFLKIFLRPCHFYPESAIKLVSSMGSDKEKIQTQNAALRLFWNEHWEPSKKNHIAGRIGGNKKNIREKKSKKRRLKTQMSPKDS